MTDHEKLTADPEFWRRQADLMEARAIELRAEAGRCDQSAEDYRNQAEELERGKP